MSNITEWLANLSYVAVIIIMTVLITLRFVLLKLSTSQLAKSIAELAESLAIAMGLVFLIIRPFFVQAFFIPSESMVPTLEISDHILVNKAVYLHRDPKPGEVVVFKAPPEALKIASSNSQEAQLTRQTDYIKRCIAGPGDTLYVVGGFLTINGQEFSHDYVQSRIADAYGASYMQGNLHVKFAPEGVYNEGKLINKDRLLEILGFLPGAEIEIHPGYVVVNGRKLTEPYINEDPDSDYPDFNNPSYVTNLDRAVTSGRLRIVDVDGRKAIKLGKNQFFMMGDNRNHSSDSRMWGPLDGSRVVGRSMFIFFPFNRIRWVR